MRPCRRRSGKTGGGPGPACRRDRRPSPAAGPRPRAAARSADRDRIRRWPRSGSGSGSGTAHNSDGISAASSASVSWLLTTSSSLACRRMFAGRMDGRKTRPALAREQACSVAESCSLVVPRCSAAASLDSRTVCVELEPVCTAINAGMRPASRDAGRKFARRHKTIGGNHDTSRSVRWRGAPSSRAPDSALARGVAGALSAAPAQSAEPLPKAARSGAANTGPRRATCPCGCFASGSARRRPASRRGRCCSSSTARR